MLADDILLESETLNEDFGAADLASILRYSKIGCAEIRILCLGQVVEKCYEHCPKGFSKFIVLMKAYRNEYSLHSYL